MKDLPLTRELVSYLLKQEGSDLVRQLQIVINGSGDNFVYDAAEDIVDRLQIISWKNESVYQECYEYLASAKTFLGQYVYSRLNERSGKTEDALAGLTEVINRLSQSDPYVLLQRAKLWFKVNKVKEAAEDLRLALELHPPYAFFLKSEKLLERIIKSDGWQPRRSVRIAIAAGATTTFLVPVLKAACFKSGIRLDVYQGNFGNYQQDILDINSGLHNFKPEIVVFFPNPFDLRLPPVVEGSLEEDIAEQTRNLWSVLQQQNPCHILQIGYYNPPAGAWGSLEDILLGGRRRLIEGLNRKLSGNLPPGISFLNINNIALELGSAFISDPEWYRFKQYPSTQALPFLADFMTAHLRAVLGLSAKVLVLDLDNTLWGGVIGEDGLPGIVLGPPSAEGEAYQDLQRYAKELKERGILLAICSKNNLQDALLPFEQHDSMVLKREDIVLFAANWKDKASNLEEAAETLALGLDSFVFLDDNPLERAWVRSKLPQVIVPECGSKPWEMLSCLRRGMYFETLALTSEDGQRHNSYKANVERNELQKKAASLDEFLTGLDMRAGCGPVSDETLKRVTQLLNKTNQFNLTSRRYNEDQVKAMAASGEWWTRWYRLKDRYGDYGLVGVILAEREKQRWVIDTWLMSCRVLGRQMERFMWMDFVTAAAQEGISEVLGLYIPTPKNQLVKDLYSSLGFQTGKNANEYYFKVNSSNLPVSPFIRRAD
jgi:FkbH-like protein